MRGSPIMIVCAAALFASSARGQENASAPLFAEGQRLMAEGRYQEACPRFEQALVFTPGVGTKFNLADCFERIGRLATALKLFREVEEITRQVGQDDRAIAAEQRVASLERRVPRLTVHAPWVASLPKAIIQLDGVRLAPAELGKPQPVDLGRHEVIVIVDGRRTRREVVIDRERQAPVVRLEAPAEPPRSAPAEPAQDNQARRWTGYALGGTGAVALGIGAFVVLGAKGRYDDATSACGGACPPADAERANDARSAANVGGVVCGIAVGAIAAGAILLLTSPRLK